MILADVMNELGDALDTIDGLRVYRFPADAVQHPAAVVGYPENMEYDVTYGRGCDRWEIPIVVALAKQWDRATAAKISGYVSGSGAGSVKSAIEAHTYTALDVAVVKSCTFEDYTIAGTEYLAAVFMVDVVGPGATE